ncbi:MAG: phosphate ABC transporter substrate-binding protein PstS, partial [Rhizobiaceae bacterium]|nr:phosphate ABC transporter substrate-binding protein PstS [Rhizobiaceae bacterium]
MKIGIFTKGAKVAAVAAAMVVSGTVAQAADTSLTGSGASFPFPLYSAWFKDFGQKTGIEVNYQAKGSGGGIEDFTNRVVDFAASDAAMNDEEMAKVDGGVVLLPMTAGEVVLAYNLDGVSELKLPRDVYPKIFLGEIT